MKRKRKGGHSDGESRTAEKNYGDKNESFGYWRSRLYWFARCKTVDEEWAQGYGF